jgi:carboxymethylenebutenolidase
MDNITASKEAKRPALLVLQEWWGVNDHIRDIARRLTEEGFVAQPVDFYDGRVTKNAEEARQWMMALDMAAALNKMNEAVNQLQKNPSVSSIGSIGFCMGGYLSLNLACHNKNIQAAVAFYGSVPGNEVLEKLSAPLLYVYGKEDQFIAASDVDRLERFMKSAGNPGEVLRYPGADHAFFNDTRKEVYSPENAKDAWRRTLAFLRKYLK